MIVLVNPDMSWAPPSLSQHFYTAFLDLNRAGRLCLILVSPRTCLSVPISPLQFYADLRGRTYTTGHLPVGDLLVLCYHAPEACAPSVSQRGGLCFQAYSRSFSPSGHSLPALEPGRGGDNRPACSLVVTGSYAVPITMYYVESWVS